MPNKHSIDGRHCVSAIYSQVLPMMPARSCTSVLPKLVMLKDNSVTGMTDIIYSVSCRLGNVDI